MVVSLGGFYEGPNGEFNWPMVDQEFNEYGVEQLRDTRLVRENVAAEIAKLKQEPGKGLAIMGSPNLTASLLGMGLVDELRVMVHPILLAGGRSLFRTLGDRLPLELLQTRTFRSGNVLLTYRPA
jgi:dihydrofolate reductase